MSEGIVILRKRNLDEFKELGYSYELIFEGRDLFESPTTVLLRIRKPDQNSKQRLEVVPNPVE